MLKTRARRMFAFSWVLGCSLGAQADAPPGRYVVNGDGTVYDTRTQLTWQQTAASSTYQQPGAVSHCASPALPGSGWRLPSVSELLTIVDPTRYNPAIDPTAFPGATADSFWTASAYGGAAGNAWVVFFYNGNSYGTTTSSAYHARCVR